MFNSFFNIDQIYIYIYKYYYNCCITTEIKHLYCYIYTKFKNKCIKSRRNFISSTENCINFSKKLPYMLFVHINLILDVLMHQLITYRIFINKIHEYFDITVCVFQFEIRHTHRY